jgi:hypothetical protein
MKRYLPLMCVFLLAGNTFLNAQAWENFNTTSTTNLPQWTEQSGDWYIEGQKLNPPSLMEMNYITYNGSTIPDGCITAIATYPRVSGHRGAGLTARYTSNAANITAEIKDIENAGYWNSYFIYNNGNIVAKGYGLNFGRDVKMQFEFTGSMAILRLDTNRNDSWDYVFNAIVSNQSSGLCGIAAESTSYIDDWSYSTTSTQLPFPAATITGDNEVCEGETQITYHIAPIPFATTYEWSYTGNNVVFLGFGQNIVLNFGRGATSGILTVRGANMYGVGVSSEQFAVTVSPLPSEPGEITGQDTICRSSSGTIFSISTITNADAYEWIYSGQGATINGNGNSILLDFNPTATSGRLTVRGTNGCGYGPSSIPLDIYTTTCTGITEMIPENKFQVGPNPNKGLINIKIYSSESASYQIQIIDLLGNIVVEEKVDNTPGNNHYKLSLSDKPDGMYYVCFLSKTNKIIRPIVLSK